MVKWNRTSVVKRWTGAMFIEFKAQGLVYLVFGDYLHSNFLWVKICGGIGRTEELLLFLLDFF